MLDLQSKLNEWFLGLPEGRRKALLDGDRWMLAGAAFEAGAALTSAPAEPVAWKIASSYFNTLESIPVDLRAVTSPEPLYAAPRGSTTSIVALASAHAGADARDPECEYIDELIFKLECFIDHATGGKLSKSSWALETLKAAHDEYVKAREDAAVAEVAETPPAAGAIDAFLDHWMSDVPEEYRPAARWRAQKDIQENQAAGPLRTAWDAWQACLAQAGAIDAQEKIPEGVLTAIRNEGLTLCKTERGYVLMRLGEIKAQSAASPPEAPAAAGAIDAREQEVLECERCGLPPTEHKPSHWCDNQSFAAPASRSHDDALMKLSQFAHTAAHMSESDMRNNLSSIADQLIVLASRAKAAGAIDARGQECWACNGSKTVTTSSNGSGLIDVPCEACASREQEAGLSNLLTLWRASAPERTDLPGALSFQLEKFASAVATQAILSVRATRQEAPAAAGAALAVASGPTLNKKDLNKLLNDFARACTFGNDLLARMAASKAIHEYLDSAFAALAATPALTSVQIIEAADECGLDIGPEVFAFARAVVALNAAQPIEWEGRK